MVSPSAARLMQATRAQHFRAGTIQRWGYVNRNNFRAYRFVFRENRVPYYQRLFQNHDGKRQWWKTHRSGFILYPFYTMLIGSLTASLYGTFRVMFGHKTWY